MNGFCPIVKWPALPYPRFPTDIEPPSIARYGYQPHRHVPLHVRRDFFQLNRIISDEGEALIGPPRLEFYVGTDALPSTGLGTWTHRRAGRIWARATELIPYSN